MTRRTLLCKPLVALALLSALAPSVAPAGGIYGTKRTCPLQVKNWSGSDLKIELTHYYGVYSDFYKVGTLKPGEVKQAGTLSYYTGGSMAGDYWTVSAEYKDSTGMTWALWRTLDSYDLRAIDAGVPLTVIITRGDFSYETSTDMKLNFYSNAGSRLNLPMYRMIIW